MQAPVKGVVFLTGLATDGVPDVNGMGFVKNRPGSRLFNGERFLGIASKDFLVSKGLRGKVFNGVASKGSGMQLL
jgi:hypothetical protein